MPRGAKPGERRGGRASGAPNKATVATRVAAKRAAKITAEAQAKKAAVDGAQKASERPARKRKAKAAAAAPETPATPTPALPVRTESEARAEATADAIVDHPCDPVAVMLDLCQWAFDEFNRLRGLPGGKEVIDLADGTRVTNTVKEYAMRAATLAREAAPYKSPKLANVAVTKTEDRQITIVVQRQGVVEKQATFIDGVFTEIVQQEIAA